MMWDEAKAVKEIHGLSGDARLHLQHNWRNFLARMMFHVEHSHEAQQEILEMGEELRRLKL